MKVKVAEATGIVLDWLVTKAKDDSIAGYMDQFKFEYDCNPNAHLCFSTNWDAGGPIIERERIAVWEYIDAWGASIRSTGKQGFGPTPLVAAMRCYVASKLGDEVEVPDELNQGENE